LLTHCQIAAVRRADGPRLGLPPTGTVECEDEGNLKGVEGI